MEKTRFCTMMVRKHHRDCVWYLLANDRVVVEWWVECKAVCGVQWQEDMIDDARRVSSAFCSSASKGGSPRA
jgi:hypothetical protein